MSTMKRGFAPAWFAVVSLVLSLPVSTNAWAAAKALDPVAVAKLKQMTEFLDGLKKFSVRAQNTIEDLNAGGHRVDYDLATTMTAKRPNKLRADRTGEATNQMFFYDGKALTLYSPGEQVYATETAPETIEDTVTFARESIGVLLPAADLLYRNVYPLFMRDVTLAAVVGKTVIGGGKCDHLLFSRPGADFQIWISDGPQPWPRKYIVTDTDTAARLSITSVFTEWSDSPAVDDARFTFVPPKGTTPIRFIRPGRTVSGR